MLVAVGFVQGTFLGLLPAPNNTGVCFSLSIHWACRDHAAGAVQLVGHLAAAYYAAGSTHAVNQMQTAGNLMAAGAIGLPTLVAIAQALYPNLLRAAPVVAGQALTPANVVAALNAAPYDDILIWMVNPTVAGNRGHVVAVDRFNLRFFDANRGIFRSNDGAEFHTEIASYLDVTYAIPGTYTHFSAFALDIA